MRLARVEYEFFDFEDASAEASELHRQVRLQFDDAPLLFVSWTRERQQTADDQPYSIGFGPECYFTDEPAVVVDASSAPLWAGHISREVLLAFSPAASKDFEYQILEVRSDWGTTFFFSLGLDRMGLSNTLPAAALAGSRTLPNKPLQPTSGRKIEVQ